MSEKQRFDDWPERYDRWFETPVGKAVLKYETELILEMLRPGRESSRVQDAKKGVGKHLVKANFDNVTIVLKGPKFPGNVGSAARCAMNMGIGKMIVVGNRDLDDEAVRQMATHVAKEIVDGIRHCDTLDEALAGFSWVVGTTARQGSGRGPVVSPRRMAEILVGLSQENEIALLFGPEDTGLTNDDLRFCQTLVTIPTVGFKSLNLSHAVMVDLLRAARRPDGKGWRSCAEAGQCEGAGGDVRPAQGDPAGDRVPAAGQPRLLDDAPPPPLFPDDPAGAGGQDPPGDLPADRVVRGPQGAQIFLTFRRHARKKTYGIAVRERDSNGQS